MVVYQSSERCEPWFPLWHFWFGDLKGGAVSALHAKRWFRSNPGHDTAVCMRFGAVWSAACDGGLDTWANTPRGRLALILLCDQIGRNLWRGDSRAYALDARALHLCREGLNRRHDTQLSSLERVFFYFPLHHSENLNDQQDYCDLLAQLHRNASVGLQDRLARFHHHGVRYRSIIARFGRFPHRNRVLGRPHTPAEHQFMRKPDGK